MKLITYVNFLESFIALNKTTQGKVVDFMRKFREDSTSAAINLERINTFKDQTLRTARIDQKYRAILKEVEPRKIYLIVWVDNHDEAMRWAENKMIDWNESVQAFQVYDSIELEEEVTFEKQEETVEPKFIFKYDADDLKDVGVPKSLIPAVLKIEDLTGLEKLEENLPKDAFEHLFYLMDGVDIELIKRDIEEGKVKSDKLETQIASDNNKRSFIEIFDEDDILKEALNGDLNKWKYFLHPSQAALVNKDYNGAIKVTGGAGTGKTVAALHRMKYLSKSVNAELPILFSTFTRELTMSLETLASSLGIDSNTYEIQNIDRVARNLALKYGVIDASAYIFYLNARRKPEQVWTDLLESELSSFDESFLQNEYEQVILANNITTMADYFKVSRVGRGKAINRFKRKEVWDLVEKFKAKCEDLSLYYKEEVYNLLTDYLTENKTNCYSHIIVDELQDFSNVELRLMRALVKEGMNDLFLVGDPLQNIYDKTVVFSQCNINVKGGRSKRLRINYRTSEEIKRLAIQVVSGEKFEDFDGGEESKQGYQSLFHGLRPTYKLFNSREEELDEVLNEINKLVQERNYSYSSIAIAARKKGSLKEFRNKMHVSNIPYTDKDLLNSNNEGVRLASFHNMKGLEFKHVFLVDVNNNTLPLITRDYNSKSEIDQQLHLRGEKSLFYVACSRSMYTVSISGIGEGSEIIPKEEELVRR